MMGIGCTSFCWRGNYAGNFINLNIVIRGAFSGFSRLAFVIDLCVLEFFDFERAVAPKKVADWNLVISMYDRMLSIGA